MPMQAGIIVEVLTGRGSTKAKEYGVQHIRGKTRVAAYIESQTGVIFRVGIQPTHPYFTYGTRGTLTYGVRNPAAGRFDFLASIYIDGRAKPEMRRVIYLDPKHPQFDGGILYLNGRASTDVNGNAVRLPWVFEDAWGLYRVFGRMNVAAGGVVRGDDGAKGKPGLIQVVIERIQPLGVLEGYMPNQQDAEGRDLGMGDVEEDVTHVTGFGCAKTADAPRLGITSTYYKPGEGPFAIFDFFYRSAEKLARYNFKDFDARGGPPIIMPEISRLQLGTGNKREREDVVEDEDGKEEKEGKRVRQ